MMLHNYECIHKSCYSLCVLNGKGLPIQFRQHYKMRIGQQITVHASFSFFQQFQALWHSWIQTYDTEEVPQTAAENVFYQTCIWEQPRAAQSLSHTLCLLWWSGQPIHLPECSHRWGAGTGCSHRWATAGDELACHCPPPDWPNVAIWSTVLCNERASMSHPPWEQAGCKLMQPQEAQAAATISAISLPAETFCPYNGLCGDRLWGTERTHGSEGYRKML